MGLLNNNELECVLDEINFNFDSVPKDSDNFFDIRKDTDLVIKVESVIKLSKDYCIGKNIDVIIKDDGEIIDTFNLKINHFLEGYKKDGLFIGMIKGKCDCFESSVVGKLMVEKYYEII